jgi:hypothetical protein
LDLGEENFRELLVLLSSDIANGTQECMTTWVFGPVERHQLVRYNVDAEILKSKEPHLPKVIRLRKNGPEGKGSLLTIFGFCNSSASKSVSSCRKPVGISLFGKLVFKTKVGILEGDF